MTTASRKDTLLKHVGAHLALLLVCAVILIPILYTLSVSLSGENTLLSSRLNLFPESITLENYGEILFGKPFLRWLGNSLLLAGLTVAFSLAVTVPAAYAYSRMEFRGKKPLLFGFLLLNAFPSILSMVAVYRLFRLLHLMNTFTGLILVYSGSMIIFALWNLKGFFDSIPVSIEEAAEIDGASRLRILWSILLPLARPAIIVTGMLVFITTWNEYIYAVNFLTDRDNFTLAAGLYSLQGTEYARNWPLFAAGSLLVTLPVLIVFFLSQKHLTSGLTAGGVKY